MFGTVAARFAGDRESKRPLRRPAGKVAFGVVAFFFAELRTELTRCSTLCAEEVVFGFVFVAFGAVTLGDVFEDAF